MKLLSPGRVMASLLIVLFPIHCMAQSDCPNETVIDFSGLEAGTILSNQLTGSGVALISALNANTDHPDAALVFDSSNPTGDDFDLGTPNEDFGGPGEGDGDNNESSLGNLVIIAEDVEDDDGDGLVDDPDDEARGGDVVFNFENISRVKSITFVDIEDGVRVTGFDSSKLQTFSIEIGESNDNAVEVTNLFDENDEENSSLVVSLRDSGALAEVVICHSGTSVTGKPIRIARACGSTLSKKRRSRIGRKRLRQARRMKRILSRAGKRALRKGQC